MKNRAPTVGWKGLVNDPHLNNSFEINLGLRTARALLSDIVELGRCARARSTWTPDHPAIPRRPGELGARSVRAPPKSQIPPATRLRAILPDRFQEQQPTVPSKWRWMRSVRRGHSHIFLSVTKAGPLGPYFRTARQWRLPCDFARWGAAKPNFDNPSVHYASRSCSNRPTPARA